MPDLVDDLFCPLVARWFHGRFDAPTAVQLAAWPVIASGSNVLVTAPTGSGKTLTAFLYGIDRLISGAVSGGKTRILYVSPLKALNNDIRRNLVAPLDEIRALDPSISVEVAVRSGDTPQEERRRHLRRPAEIFITTPESLNLILTSRNARAMLTDVETIILDEIHAVAGSKRGTHLISAVERVARLVEHPVQRIAISATVRPLPRVAGFVAGIDPTTRAPRPIEIVDAHQPKVYELEVLAAMEDVRRDGVGTEHGHAEAADAGGGVSVDDAAPRAAADAGTAGRPGMEHGSGEAADGEDPPSGGDGALAHGGPAGDGAPTGTVGAVSAAGASAGHRVVDSPAGGAAARLPPTPRGRKRAKSDREDQESRWWMAVTDELRRRIEVHAPTLVFVNSRTHAETVALRLNRDLVEPIAYSHHGSLSREVRLEVERRLKSGELPAVVATSTLELGIDVGDLDQVILLGAPSTVMAAVQRLGRAGHRVDRVSRGTLIPMPGIDVLASVVMAQAVQDRRIEEMHIPENPLDVLAQVILSMVVVSPGRLDDLYDEVTTWWPFRGLPRSSFNQVCGMLGGRYATGRIKALEPRVILDEVEGTIRARSSAAYLLYSSGGTIPDRGYYRLVDIATGGHLGELDEEFVWERRIGDKFVFGNRPWMIVQIGYGDVHVKPLGRSHNAMAFWRGEARLRPWETAEQFLELLDLLAADVLPPGVDGALAESLVDLVKRQRAVTGVEIPHRRNVVVERIDSPEGEVDRSVIVHTFWGGRINRTVAAYVAARIEEERGAPPDYYVDDEAIFLAAPPESVALIGDLLTQPPPVSGLLRPVRRGIAPTGFFGARFRECAGRALLLPRKGFGRRTPLWVTRRRAGALFEAVANYDDFPITLETWRTIVDDDLDLPGAVDRLNEIVDGTVAVSDCSTRVPSPFAAGIAWINQNTAMYESDRAGARTGGAASGSDDAVSLLVRTKELRPVVPLWAVERASERLRRDVSSPGDADEIAVILYDRVLVEADTLARWGVVPPAADPHLAGGDSPWSVDASADLLGAAGAPRAAPPGPAAPTDEPGSPGDASGPAAPTGASGSPGDGSGAAGSGDAPLTEDPASTEAVSAEAAPAVVLAVPTPAGAVRYAHRDRRVYLQHAFAGDDEVLADLVEEWFRFAMPTTIADVVAVWGVGKERIELVVDGLVEQETLVRGALVEGDRSSVVAEVGAAPAGVVTSLAGARGGALSGGRPDLVASADVYEYLLRITRAGRRREVPQLPVARLPDLWAYIHGLGDHRRERLQEAFDPLFAYAAPVELWESSILPARVRGYNPAELDGLFVQFGMRWYGTGEATVAFCPPEGCPPSMAEPARRPPAGTVFPHDDSVASFARRRGIDLDEATRVLWEGAWAGWWSADSFHALREGLKNGFGSQRASTVRRTRWTPPPTATGRWSPLFDTFSDDDEPSADAVTDLEDRKRIVRILLDRYGILFRDLLRYESVAWSSLLRALRVMELSGEIVGGNIIPEVTTIQYARSGLLKEIADLPPAGTYWLHAKDPVSPLSVRLTADRDLPVRSDGTIVVVHEGRTAAVIRGKGRRIDTLAATGSAGSVSVSTGAVASGVAGAVASGAAIGPAGSTNAVGGFSVAPGVASGVAAPEAGDGRTETIARVIADAYAHIRSPRGDVRLDEIDGRPAADTRLGAILREHGFRKQYPGLAWDRVPI